MFRKPIPTTGTNKLGGTDQKKLRKALEKRFGCSEQDSEALIPKKCDLSLTKCAAPSRMQASVIVICKPWSTNGVLLVFLLCA